MKRSGMLLATIAMLAPLSVLAQPTPGSITFTPLSAGTTAVPTLGGALLVLLALLLGVIALRSVRHRRDSGTLSLFAGALLVGSLASGVSGLVVIQDARAGGGSIILDEAGETFDVFCGNGSYFNDSGVGMQVTAFVTPTGCTSETNIANDPVCTIGTVLEDGDVCNTNFEPTPV